MSVSDCMSSSNDLANEATPSDSSTRATSSMSMPAAASSVDDLSAAVDPGVDGPGHRAVVEEVGHGAVGHGVDRVRADQGVHVGQVGIVGVLGRGRRPQRALHPGPLGGQGLPAGAGEPLGEQLVGQPGLGHRRLAPQGQQAAGVGGPAAAASIRRSTSVSTRLMKNEATLATWERSSAPEAARASSPDR